MKSFLILAFVACASAVPLTNNRPLVQLVINVQSSQAATSPVSAAAGELQQAASANEIQIAPSQEVEQPASAYEVQVAPEQEVPGANEVQVVEEQEEEQSFIEYLKDRYKPVELNSINDLQGLLQYLQDRFTIVDPPQEHLMIT